MKDAVELKVTEAVPQDVGRGIVRLDPRATKELEVSVGDVVLIQGHKKTAAKVWPSAAKDEGSKAIRMDGVIRRNADVAIDEFVTISKAKVKKADVFNAATPMDKARVELTVEATGEEARIDSWVEEYTKIHGSFVPDREKQRQELEAAAEADKKRREDLEG